MTGVTAGADNEPPWCADGDGDGEVDIATSDRRCSPLFALAPVALDGLEVTFRVSSLSASSLLSFSCRRLMPR